MATKIKPLGARVLVEPIEEKEVTKGGIIIPDTAKEKPMQGKVIAVGVKRDDDGKELAFDVKVGDTVLHKAYGEGVVLSAKPMGNDTMLEIAFTKAGTKKIMANYAKIEKV